MKRPSFKEISGKLNQAKTAIENGNVQILNMLSILADADELGYLVDEDLGELLVELLSQSSLKNYKGGRPPEKSYEQVIAGAELFAFVIEENSLNKPVYYKFSLVKETFYLVSLHKNNK